MNCVLIASPDKISLNRFTVFLKKSLNEYRIGAMHSLMSGDSVQAYMDAFLEESPKTIFTYYAKRKIKTEPEKVIPIYAQKRADAIIWFNLFSTDPVVVKDQYNVLNNTIEDWKKYVASMAG